MIRISMLLAALLLAGACGQKGDLYFPDEEREVIDRVPLGTLLSPGPGNAQPEEEDEATAPAARPAGVAQ
jgi:predicted small lipoprotein YifL